jgi:aryl-alcohol dehydrogenase-like predicted oxidoreductase
LGKEAEGRRSKPKVTDQIERHRPQLEAYESLCREIGQQPADVALAWLLSNPTVTAPIVGPRTVDQLKQNLRAVDVTLSAETLKQLNEIWPGPGEAPQAYAW